MTAAAFSRRQLMLGGMAALAIPHLSAKAHGPEAHEPLPASTSAARIPGSSLYQLNVPLTDQAGRGFALADRRGAPMIVSMFYTSCQFVCPMLIDAIRATERKLADAERRRLKVLLVSIDPEHDTVEVLQATVGQRQVDTTRWSLARTDGKNVRKLAAALDIQYRAMDGGEFNHSTALILVDAEGRVVGRTSELSGADPAFVKLVKTTLRAG